MRSLCFIFILLVFISSCCNNSSSNKNSTETVAKDTIVVKEKLDPVLVQGVLDLVQTKEHLKFTDIPLNESAIVIGFFVFPEKADVNFSDSIAKIYYNVLINNEVPGYKGILKVDEINVAILDYWGFGSQYYNVDSLRQIPLDSFKSYPMNYISTIMFYIRDGKLIHWNP